MSNWINLPNAVTLSRIAAAPVIVGLWRASLPLTAFSLLIGAFLTDFFDGKLARRFGQVTFLGALLDPIADKIFVMSLIGLVTYEGSVPAWYLSLVLIRNISQLLSIPILIWGKGIYFNVKPKFIPKLGTALCFVIIAVGLVTKISPFLAAPDSLLLSLLIASGGIEVFILCTYWPRFLSIYHGEHDTFE